MLAFAPLSGAADAASILLDHLATLLAPVGGTATAIVALTVLVRLAVHPLTRRAVRGERARLRLAPQIAQLRRRHAKDPQRLTRELTELHQREGVSPFAGMLPTLAQAPAFLVLYRLAAHLPDGGHTLLGVGLGVRLAGAALPQLWVFGLLLGGLAVVALLTARRSARLIALTPGPVPTGVVARLPRISPFVTVVTAAFLPLAAGLYLLTSSTWTLAENAALHRGLLS